MNRAKQTADEYRHLGGRRLAAFDDNKASTRAWDKDTPEAERFGRRGLRPSRIRSALRSSRSCHQSLTRPTSHAADTNILSAVLKLSDFQNV